MDDEYGPSLPPELAAARAEQGRVLKGPLPPPPDDDDDDDDFGPKPLPSGINQDDSSESDGVKEFIQKEQSRQKKTQESLLPQKLKRDEWMLTPPSSSAGFLASLNPSKLSKPRHFSRSTNEKVVDNSLWTETPQDRLQRLSEEVSGKRKRVDGGGGDVARGGDEKKRRRNNEIKEKIEEHNRLTRPVALVDLHSSTEPSSSKHHPSKTDVIWDRDRDMGLGGKLMDSTSRNKLIQDAKRLGDRFGTGKGGGYTD